jgi:7,8-didemethyl-8-hydroxy-5-deazariboflavin synthase CofH subunit
VTLEGMLGVIDIGIARILDRALSGEELSVEEASTLFRVGHREFPVLVMAADELRKSTVGDMISFVHNRNINFTNYCVGSCLFCAFRRPLGDRKNGYTLTLEQIVEKAVEARGRGATEVCIQGGLNPELEPDFYVHVCEAVKNRLPDIHIHAFSPMEVLFASRNRGCTVRDFLTQLKSAGLDSMPGTAAEILEDSVRAVICPEKLTTGEWRFVVSEAHQLGIRSSATMMYGHIEQPAHRAVHMDLIRRMQKQGGGFTEFVPLRFISANTDLYRRGLCGLPISGVEDIKVHAIARIFFHGVIDNIQVSWVKLGRGLAEVCLHAGGNDLGGTLMEEHISRAAGCHSPSSMTVEELEELIRSCHRVPVQRTTTYERVGDSS